MFVSSNLEQTPFEEIITEFIKKRKQENFGAPATKKAEEIQKAKQSAFKQGIAVALAALANAERRELYQELPVIDGHSWSIPIEYEGTFYKFLREVEDLWELGAYKDMTDEDMFADLRTKLDAIVRDEEFESRYQHDRKRCILSGYLDPTEDDAEWLAEEVEKFKEVTAPAEAALAKLKGE